MSAGGRWERLRDEADLLLGQGVDLGQLPAILAKRWPGRLALESSEAVPGFGGRLRWTTDDIEDAVARLAAAWRAAGVGAGDTVGLALGSRIDALWHLFAVARVGAVAAPVNGRLKPEELSAVLSAAGATHLLASEEMLDAVRDAAPEDLPLWTTGPSGDVPSRTEAPSLTDALLARPDARMAAVRRDPGEVRIILCTSGTTGVPKAASLTSRGLLSGAGRLRAPGGRLFRDGEPFTVLAALPLNHVMGISTLLVALSAGAPIIHRPRFVAADALDLLASGRVGIFVGVPTMYADLEAELQAAAPPRDLSGVHIWVSSADAMPPDRARRFQARGSALTLLGRPVGSATFVDIYGMVELSGGAAVRIYPPSPLGPLDLVTPAVGLPGVELRTVDERGRPLARGERGELQVRSAGVLKGYRGRVDVGPDAEGWFSTGDFARLGPGRTFVFSGRQKDRLKVGGFSVFPAEVEAILEGHPDVAEVAVVGLPDERMGEAPTAVVVPKGERFDEAAFLDWAHRHVAGYRRPRAVLIAQAIPRGKNGKVDRSAATELARSLAG